MGERIDNIIKELSRRTGYENPTVVVPSLEYHLALARTAAAWIAKLQVALREAAAWQHEYCHAVCKCALGSKDPDYGFSDE